MRVLIAEDDVTSRAMLQAVPVKWGYDVTAASDGEQAWAALQEPDAPGLAVLDWEMLEALAGGDIIRLLELVRQVEPLDRDAARGLKALADRYDYPTLEKLLGNGGADILS